MSATVQPVRWTAPGLAAKPAASVAPPSVAPPSVEDLQALEQAAHAEGFRRGHADGLAAGQADIRRMVAQIEGILDSFTRPLARLDGEVADALTDLAARIAGTLLGRAYSGDPALLADLVHEALDAVGPHPGPGDEKRHGVARVDHVGRGGRRVIAGNANDRAPE